MINAHFDTEGFNREMSNIANYALGFLEGVQKGKTQFLAALGAGMTEALEQFIDSNARVNPETLNHIYEWYQTGSPESRLFDIDYTVSNLGLSFRSTFSQSDSIKAGSNEPFYDKARIMEQGVPVTIRPKRAKVLAFQDMDQTIFTKGPVRVNEPGGPQTTGSFEKVFDLFFNAYFTQSFMQSSGISNRLKSPVAFKNNLKAGARGGKAKGVETGYRWIANVVVE